MNIMALPTTLSEAKALEIAKGCGNLAGRLLLGKKPVTLRFMYLEQKEIIYQMSYEPAPLLRILGKETSPIPGQKIRMILEGTRGTPSYLGEPLPLVSTEISDPSILQYTEFPDDHLIEQGKILARRIVRRQIGKTVSLSCLEMNSVFRPYYIAFYGPLTEGTKVRYLPIPADGHKVSRVC